MTINASGIVLAMLTIYKQVFSSYMPGQCRYMPSCSEYTAEAIQLHGARRGMVMGIRRLARCRPFGPKGYDPPPQPVILGE